jgi:biopolymer transport protein ExbB
MNVFDLLFRGDGVSTAVALALLVMSVGSWVVILWKSWLVHRAVADMARAVAAFWLADSMDHALDQLRVFDRETIISPLVEAARAQPVGVLAARADRSQQLTRVLRDALHAVLQRLQAGQVLLATVGATAPFVGLLGTVWGIYHALVGIAAGGVVSIEKIAGPVGESLIMTAAGLAVAIPAVLGYNILGRFLGRIEADLEGFARDLRELLLSSANDH